MARLLLVDDETIVTQTLQTALEPVFPDCDIFSVNSAPDALQLLHLYSFDVVVTDINMPQMDGIALLKEIRKCWPMCYVIILTAYDSFDYVYQATKYDDVRFLLKLEEMDVIADAIRHGLDRVREKFRQMLNEQVLARMDGLQPLVQMTMLEHAVRTGVLPGEDVFPDNVPRTGDHFLLVTARYGNESSREILRILETMLKKAGMVCLAYDQGDQITFVIPSGPEKNETDTIRFVREQLDQILEQLSMGEDNDEIGIAFSDGFIPWRDMPAMSERLTEAVRTEEISGRIIMVPLSATETGKEDSARREQEKRGTQSRLIEQIRAYISDHLSEPLSLTTLSEVLHYNSSYLSRAYKQMTGEGLNEYITRTRIAYASRLLEEETVDIERIAAESGFQTTKYFRAVFKRETGFSPLNWHQETPRRKKTNGMSNQETGKM